MTEEEFEDIHRRLVALITPMCEQQHKPGVSRRARIALLRALKMKTWSEIGQEFGISGSAVRQIDVALRRKVVRKIRCYPVTRTLFDESDLPLSLYRAWGMEHLFKGAQHDDGG